MDMDWAHWRTISDLVSSGQHRAALDRLAGHQAGQAGPNDLPTIYIVLKAQALSGLGQPSHAAAELMHVIARGDPDFWTWYTLAETRRLLFDWPGAAEASRNAHALAGWPESPAHEYRFTHDYFAANLLDWQAWFDQHIIAAPLHALEIGSWQGGSACWLLDRVIGPRGGRLTCVDPFSGSSEHAFLPGMMAELGDTLEGYFDRNIARTGHAARLRKLRGYSQDVLPTLHGEHFDFIYIDGAHEAKWVIQDAVLCWGLLAPGGHLLFDDVPFTFPDHPEQNTARAIDFFTSVFADELETVASGRQLLLRRRP